MILLPALAEKATTLKIHRSSNGAVLGAGPLWIPGNFVESHIRPGQEEIEVTFEGNRILIGKEESPTAAGQREYPDEGTYGLHQLSKP